MAGCAEYKAMKKKKKKKSRYRKKKKNKRGKVHRPHLCVCVCALVAMAPPHRERKSRVVISTFFSRDKSHWLTPGAIDKSSSNYHSSIGKSVSESAISLSSGRLFLVPVCCMM